MVCPGDPLWNPHMTLRLYPGEYGYASGMHFLGVNQELWISLGNISLYDTSSGP